MQTVLLALAASVFVLLASCWEPAKKHPVSQWLNEGDPCIRSSAEAIVKSGLPFPNYRTEPAPAAASGAPARQRITHVDMWLGPTRYVIPAAVASRNGFYPEQHPRLFEGLSGSLPQFYPPGPPGPEIDGMGSMVDVKLVCRMDAKYIESWGKGDRSNAQSVERVRATYQELATYTPDIARPVTSSRRDEIDMLEVWVDGRARTDGTRAWEASYWPIAQDLTGFDGSITSIDCRTRYDPIERRYGKVGWRCMANLRLERHGHAQIEIYVSQLHAMPEVFEQVKSLLRDAKQEPGG